MAVGGYARELSEDRIPVLTDERSEDAESLGPHPGTGGLVLTGLDDHEGPPEGHRAPARLHDEYRWLGSCREFARVLPPEQAEPPLVLRGSPRVSGYGRPATGTRRALNLGGGLAGDTGRLG